jgi:hypothetical protein
VPNYIRVKRLTSTYFVCVSAKDNVARVKQILGDTILNGEKKSEEMRLYISKTPGDYTLLDDTLPVEKAGLENDMVVYLCYYDADQGNEIGLSVQGEYMLMLKLMMIISTLKYDILRQMGRCPSVAA